MKLRFGKCSNCAWSGSKRRCCCETTAVCCGVLLGKGQFGDVLVGKAYSIVANVAETLVMLKSLLSPDEQTQAEFYRELELFSRCHHDNVVKLLGISRESFPVFAIYEYTDLVSRSSSTNMFHHHVFHYNIKVFQGQSTAEACLWGGHGPKNRCGPGRWPPKMHVKCKKWSIFVSFATNVPPECHM